MTTWDDLGVVEVGCYLDESEVTCLQRLRAEACRMGGDMIYNVPKRALRPLERAMVYRGMVAHTREDAGRAGRRQAHRAPPRRRRLRPDHPAAARRPARSCAPPTDGGIDGAI